MELLKIGNKTISTPLIDIIKDIKGMLRNGKLAVIRSVGDDIKVTCPHHSKGLEKNADAYVYIGKSTDKVKYGDFHCFACGEAGPFYHFVAECFDRTDDWARTWLITNYSDGMIEYEADLPIIDLSPKPKKKYIKEDELDKLESFHPYMLKRKLTKEVCKEFEVKYDPQSKCIVFPVRDEKGNLVMFTKRSVETKMFLIPPDVEKPVYLLNYLLQKNITEAYICESQINALTLWTHGLPGIALFGTGSQHQYDILNKSNIRVYNLLFDGDSAGDKGIRKFIENIRKDVIVNVMTVPRGKDINDMSYEEVENLINTSLTF